MSYQTVLRAVQRWLGYNFINLHNILEWRKNVNASCLISFAEYDEEAEMMEMLQDLLH